MLPASVMLREKSEYRGFFSDLEVGFLWGGLERGGEVMVDEFFLVMRRGVHCKRNALMR